MELRALDNKRKKLRKEQRQKLREAAVERKEARANLFECSPQSRTLVLYHPECLEHIPKAKGDWENPDRIRSIMERIRGAQEESGIPSIYPREIQISQEFERAKLDLLSRVHSTEYLNSSGAVGSAFRLRVSRKHRFSVSLLRILTSRLLRNRSERRAMPRGVAGRSFERA